MKFLGIVIDSAAAHRDATRKIVSIVSLGLSNAMTFKNQQKGTKSFRGTFVFTSRAVYERVPLRAYSWTLFAA